MNHPENDKQYDLFMDQTEEFEACNCCNGPVQGYPPDGVVSCDEGGCGIVEGQTHTRYYTDFGGDENETIHEKDLNKAFIIWLNRKQD